MSHDEGFEYLERHLKVVKKLYRPKAYFMHLDEIRLAGWCELCDRLNLTTGQVLARCVRRCSDMVRRVDPKAEIVTWNDMFDPHHNAVDNYWLTRGTMKRSWEGLDKDVLICNWNQGHRDKSLAFFSNRGYRQILATYYDQTHWQEVVRGWLSSAEAIQSVDGIIYTTWNNDYRYLEEFIELANSQ